MTFDHKRLIIGLEDKGHTMIATAGAVGVKKEEERMLAGTTAEDSTKEEAPEILNADHDVDTWRGAVPATAPQAPESESLFFYLKCGVAGASYLTAVCLSFLLCKM